MRRRLTIGDKGADVTALQQALNKRSAQRGLPIIHVDGQYGHQTDRAVDRVSRALGALEKTIQQDGATIGQQRIIRAPGTRNPRQLARAKSRAKHAAQQAAREARNKPKVTGNSVRGGTGSDRVVAAARAALTLDLQGKRPSFYSQPGRWTVDHTITGEKPGERSDCSQFVTALHKSSALTDPNANKYTGGYTGTLANACRRIPRDQARDGDLVIWDPYGSQGHVEILEDHNTMQSIGHGSRHVARHHVSDFNYKGTPGFYRRPGAK